MHRNPHLDVPVTIWGSEAGKARTAVIAVHGRGQSPAFMLEQSGRLDAEETRFYGPAASGQTWYPKPFLEDLAENEPYLSHSLDALEALIAAVKAEGFAQDRIVLWGFSQGACLISHLALTRPSSYGGLALLTGGFVGSATLPLPQGRPLKGTPVVMRSIEHDPWVPKSRVEETATALATAGATVDLRVSPGNEHVITAEAMSAVTRLLDEI